MEIEQQIEAILFYKAEPVKKKTLAELLSIPIEEIDGVLQTLEKNLSGRGVALSTTDTTVELVTSPECHHVIESMRKEELSADIGKAGAETLAIILYRGPLSRGEIDRIRGVNSTFILRNLLIRGLIERRSHPSDSRSYVYTITTTLLNHLGIQRREELPDFSEIMNTLDTFEREATEQEQASPFQGTVSTDE